MAYKPLSGAAKRRARREREEGRALSTLKAPVASEPDAPDAYLEAVQALGPPPTDPIETIVWTNRLAAITAWHAAVDPMSQIALVRRRGVLEAIKAISSTNSKAVDKAKMLQVAKRLGIVDKDEDGLEKRSAGSPSSLRA